MTRIFDNFEAGKRALLAQQSVLNTVGHNLANVGTPGYTRQRAELQPAMTQNGVDVGSIARIRDRFLDLSLLTESRALGEYEAQHGMLQRLEAIFNDPADTGLSGLMDGLFQGFEEVSVSPTDQALRVTLRDGGERLASLFRSMRARLDQLKGDVVTQVKENVSTANALVTQIGELHRQILASAGGPAPNDLFDKRDLLVEQLNRVIGVSATDRPDGTVQLAVSGTGVLLVDGTITTPLSTTSNTAADTLELRAGNLVVTPRGGQLSALLTARNSSTGAIKQAASDLDTLARSIIAEVNRLHAGGAGLTGSTALTAANAVSSESAPLSAAGLPFPPGSGSFQVIVWDATGAVKSMVTVDVTAGVTTLDDVAAGIEDAHELDATITDGRLAISAAGGYTFGFAGDTSDTLLGLGLNGFFTGSSAADIALDPVIAADPTRIAAATPDADGLVHPGDGSNALGLARLRTRLSMGGGAATFTDFFGTAVSRVGSQLRDTRMAVERQELSVQVVQTLQQQTSGVSTDEELIALTQAQDAYAAAARFITTTQVMVQTLLDMVL
jgi:flagellar hook-associated protein 1 FlgK